MRARLAIGVGFRGAATADDLVALIRTALSGLPAHLAGRPTTLTTLAAKDQPAFREAAARLGLPLLILPASALRAVEDRVTVVSEAARACLGVASVAEAAALAACGPGGRLVVSRRASAVATCAVAASPEDPA